MPEAQAKLRAATNVKHRRPLSVIITHFYDNLIPFYILFAKLNIFIFYTLYIYIQTIWLCISNLFMLNSVITISQLYGSGFSFLKTSFPLLYPYLCRSKFCVGQKI